MGTTIITKIFCVIKIERRDKPERDTHFTSFLRNSRNALSNKSLPLSMGSHPYRWTHRLRRSSNGHRHPHSDENRSKTTVLIQAADKSQSLPHHLPHQKIPLQLWYVTHHRCQNHHDLFVPQHTPPQARQARKPVLRDRKFTLNTLNNNHKS